MQLEAAALANSGLELPHVRPNVDSRAAASTSLSPGHSAWYPAHGNMLSCRDRCCYKELRVPSHALLLDEEFLLAS